MYLARTKIKNQIHYYIRDTYQDGSYLKSRDVFYLGTDPSRYIIYSSGHGYYYDEVIEDTLLQFGLQPDQDEFNRIFREFLDPEIKRVITGFQRSFSTSKTVSLKTYPLIHVFDKRRIHYLKFAQMDQRNIHRMPHKLFKVLSRNHFHSKTTGFKPNQDGSGIMGGARSLCTGLGQSHYAFQKAKFQGSGSFSERPVARNVEIRLLSEHQIL